MVNNTDIFKIPEVNSSETHDGIKEPIIKVKNVVSELIEDNNRFSNDDLVELWQIILGEESDKINLTDTNYEIRQLLYTSMMREVGKFADKVELVHYPKSQIRSLDDQKKFIKKLSDNIRALLYRKPNEDFLKQGKSQEEFDYTRRWCSWPDLANEYKTLNCVFAAMVSKHVMDKVGIKCRFGYLKGHTANIVTLSDGMNYYMDFYNSIRSKSPIGSIRMEPGIRSKIKNVKSCGIRMGKDIEKLLITNTDSDVLEGVLGNIGAMKKELSDGKDSNGVVKAIHDKYISINPNFFKIARFFKSELFRNLKSEL